MLKVNKRKRGAGEERREGRREGGKVDGKMRRWKQRRREKDGDGHLEGEREM